MCSWYTATCSKLHSAFVAQDWVSGNCVLLDVYVLVAYSLLPSAIAYILAWFGVHLEEQACHIKTQIGASKHRKVRALVVQCHHMYFLGARVHPLLHLHAKMCCLLQYAQV